MTLNLKSGLSDDMVSMLEFRHSMGFSVENYVARCKSLDRFCNEYFPNEKELNENIVLGWLQSRPNEVMILNQRASFIRVLSKYIRSTGKNAYVLPDKFIPPQKPYVPYILSDKELARLFCVIDEAPENYRLDILQPSLFSTLFRLIYTCGLRPNEGRTLLCKNIDLRSGEILITGTKAHKERIVVMSDDMCALARRYDVLRNATHPNSECFFPSKNGTPYTEKMLGWHFKNFVAAAYSDLEKESLPPVRIYDLRHRFATTVILKWIDEGKNLYSMLPYLSTYMGHAKISHTAYYIHLIPENIRASRGIDWKTMGSVIPEVQLWGK